MLELNENIIDTVKLLLLVGLVVVGGIVLMVLVVAFYAAIVGVVFGVPVYVFGWIAEHFGWFK